jgi:deazaflavin-dependent oxidoreductase (nitroreductase family)
MSVLLRTPGLERWVGKSTALLTYTGRMTGATYRTPISYAPHADSVILTGHCSRQWWRNLSADPHCRIRLRGTEREGTARILRGDEARPYFVEFLGQQPMIAKGSGIEFDASGAPNPDQVDVALADTVVVIADLDPARF